MTQWRYVKYGEKYFDSVKVFFAILTACYFFYYSATLGQWHVIDNINTIFHEAGHTLFMFFGQFLKILGGTIFQILVPVVLCAYFYANAKYYSASMLLFWVGQSIMQVSVYVGDAVSMKLVRLGGESFTHDWNYLLNVWSILPLAQPIAESIFLIAVVIYVYALYSAVRLSLER